MLQESERSWSLRFEEALMLINLGYDYVGIDWATACFLYSQVGCPLLTAEEYTKAVPI